MKSTDIVKQSMQKLNFEGKWSLKLCLMLFCLWSAGGRAQTDSTRFTLGLSYGLGSFFYSPNIQINRQVDYDSTSMQSSSRLDYLSTDVKIKPLMIKFDYKINERSTIGLLGIYNGYTASGIRVDSTWIPATSSYSVEQKQTRLVMNHVRIEAVYTILFKQKRPRIRSYFYAAIGWNDKYHRYYENNVKQNADESIYIDNLYFPIAMRYAYGIRIGITKRLFVHNEIGLGGPLYSLGITGTF